MFSVANCLCPINFNVLVGRAFFAAAGMGEMIGLSTSDILYNPLPLYHTAGGIIGVGQTLFEGIPSAIRRKFSATQYWSDCIKYDCTVRISYTIPHLLAYERLVQSSLPILIKTNAIKA